MSDPRVQALAAEAARKIKAIASQREADIQAVYKEFRTKADAIQGTSDSLNACADSQSPKAKHIRS